MSRKTRAFPLGTFSSCDFEVELSEHGLLEHPNSYWDVSCSHGLRGGSGWLLDWMGLTTSRATVRQPSSGRLRKAPIQSDL
jgi:hypothetical protein